LLAVNLREEKEKPAKMTAPSTIPQRFIPKADELGVVAVGFSGGQVSLLS
jgi:hypothetical protein